MPICLLKNLGKRYSRMAGKIGHLEKDDENHSERSVYLFWILERRREKSGEAERHSFEGASCLYSQAHIRAEAGSGTHSISIRYGYAVRVKLAAQPEMEQWEDDDQS